MVPSPAFGQGKRCFSSRFCHKQNPFLSQYNAFRSLPPFENKNRSPPRGLSSMRSDTIAESPLIDLRISVIPALTKILLFDKSGLIFSPITAVKSLYANPDQLKETRSVLILFVPAKIPVEPAAFQDACASNQMSYMQYQSSCKSQQGFRRSLPILKSCFSIDPCCSSVPPVKSDCSDFNMEKLRCQDGIN